MFSVFPRMMDMLPGSLRILVYRVLCMKTSWRFTGMYHFVGWGLQLKEQMMPVEFAGIWGEKGLG